MVYFVFDLLYLDGYDLRKVDLAKRRELLEQVVTPGPVLRISDAFPGRGRGHARSRARERSGGDSRQARAQLLESRRSRDWLKIKLVSEQEFVIGGYTEPQGDRDYFGALVLGVHEDGKLRWVGNVGTGFDQKTARRISARLQPLITTKCPSRNAPSRTAA